MPALLALLLRSGATFIFSGAAIITSMGFLNKTKQQPVAGAGISQFQIGQLLVATFAVFMGYKLVREVFG